MESHEFVSFNGGILLANPEISFYCTIKRFLVDSTKINIKTCMAWQECMSAQTSAVRPVFCQFNTKIIYIV